MEWLEIRSSAQLREFGAWYNAQSLAVRGKIAHEMCTYLEDYKKTDKARQAQKCVTAIQRDLRDKKGRRKRRRLS